MDQLPRDIVRAIARFVDRKDILSFRLACRTFGALGLPRQFEVIPVMLFRKSLENLLHISENPLYSKYVLTIEYGPGIVLNPGAQVDWIDTAKHNRNPGDSYKRFSEIDVEQAYQTHVRYYDDQRSMRATGYDFKTLQSAVSCLPNLRGVHIIWANPENRNRFENPPPAWGDAFYSMAKVMGKRNHFFEWIPRNSLREITASFAACKLAPKPLSWFDCEAFESDILGCDEEDGGVENEREDEGEDDDFEGIVRLSRFNNFVTDPTKDLGFPLVCATFETLTCIRLKFSPTGGRESALSQQHLGIALRGAQGLETLCIEEDFFGGTYCSQDRFCFASLLGSSTWPHLKHLSLASFIILQHDLPSFFARHPSITHFKLHTAFADDFDWATLLQSESLVPLWRRLRSLTLEGSWGGTNWTELFGELMSRFRDDEDYDVLKELEDTVCLWYEFGKWAQDVTGARSLRELLERYYSSEAGEAPFPLRTGQEVVDAVAQEVVDKHRFPPNFGDGIEMEKPDLVILVHRDLRGKEKAQGKKGKQRGPKRPKENRSKCGGMPQRKLLRQKIEEQIRLVMNMNYL
ncbi:hypothetical protein V493_00357 [Pseudogymnoascus sp. VKM F-4281 (FW-2241)]|nr:hypothetical protein V493_00357 [Pseudogymnoascus sp. VKM F-4281 (FW-2241)]